MAPVREDAAGSQRRGAQRRERGAEGERACLASRELTGAPAGVEDEGWVEPGPEEPWRTLGSRVMRRYLRRWVGWEFLVLCLRRRGGAMGERRWGEEIGGRGFEVWWREVFEWQNGDRRLNILLDGGDGGDPRRSVSRLV